MTSLQDAFVTVMAIAAAWAVLRRVVGRTGPSAPAAPPCASCPGSRTCPR